MAHMGSGLVSPHSLLRSRDRFLILLCLILGLHVLVPVINRFVVARILIDAFMTAIVVSLTYTISNKKIHLVAGAFFGLLLLVSLWVPAASQNRWLAASGMAAGAVCFAVGIASLLDFIRKSGEVSLEAIYASILVYLLAAFMWAFVYTFLELVDPGSFNTGPLRPDELLLVFEYYSLVTLTTLGYGDIAPVTQVARAFSTLEAIVGQLYLVVAVAWLVGMYVSRKSN